MDVAWSIYKSGFSSKITYATNLHDIADAQELTCGFMDLWMDEMHERSLEVLYEEMVGDFEANARRIVSFAGLEWDDGCLDTDAVSRTVRTVSLWQVRQPVFTSSVGSWRRYAAQLADVQTRISAQIAAYENRLGADL